MRKKFKVVDPSTGERYKPGDKKMVVMNSDGVFFVFCGEKYYPSLWKLSDKLPKYDIVWED